MMPETTSTVTAEPTLPAFPDHKIFRELSRQFSLIRTRGKRPLEKDWQRWCHEKREYDEIGFVPSDNAGIATGPASGSLVVDIDDFKRFKETLLEHGTPGAIKTRIHKTGSGRGYHLFYKYPTDGRKYSNRALHDSHGFDIRGDGGQVIAPGSVHPETGMRYEIFRDAPMIEAPKWILDLAAGEKAPDERRHSASDSKSIFDGIPKGSRDDALFREACRYRMRGLSMEEAYVLIEEAAARCVPPFVPEDARRKVESAWRYAPEYNLTDSGNAERLVFHHGQTIRYNVTSKQWVIWTGKQWVSDPAGSKIYQLAKDVVRSMYGEAKASDDETRRRQLASHASKSESEKSLRAMVNLAKNEKGMPVTSDQFDAHPWLLNVQNGVIDLWTGALMPHDSGLMQSKILPIDYDPTATCPLWESFLDRVMAGNKDLIGFLQQALGYALTGDTSEQCLFFLYGIGANGKSTFLETIKELLADYSKQADFTTFVYSKSAKGGPRNDIAWLAGARLITASETEADQKMAETIVKQLTGGDTIAARRLYQDFFEFRPAFKLFLGGNYKPKVSGTDDGIWRRIHLIPFTVTIPPEERDAKLKEKLKAELPEILAWAVRGCLAWQRAGLNPPTEVKAATDSYRTEMDSVAGFIDECCILERSKIVRAGTLYEQYQKWGNENGVDIVAIKEFRARLLARGVAGGRDKHGNYYVGVCLKFGGGEITS